MTVIFDLDHTLLDADRLKAAMAASLADCGIGEARFWETYRGMSGTAEKFCDYDPERHIAELGKDMTCSREEALERIGRAVARAQEFLFPGARALLEKLKNDGATLILLTRGDPAWQERKVEASGLSGSFDEIIYAPGDKTEAAGAIRRHAPPVVMVNDHGGEIDDLQAALPQVKMIAVRGPKDAPSDPGIPVCDSLGDVYGQIMRRA